MSLMTIIFLNALYNINNIIIMHLFFILQLLDSPLKALHFTITALALSVLTHIQSSASQCRVPEDGFSLRIFIQAYHLVNIRSKIS